MQIELVIEVSDEDVDITNETGLTEKAYLALSDALSNVSEGIVSINQVW
jgi:hypothetical protein